MNPAMRKNMKTSLQKLKVEMMVFLCLRHNCPMLSQWWYGFRLCQSPQKICSNNWFSLWCRKMITFHEEANFKNWNWISKNIHTHRQWKSTRTVIKIDSHRSLIFVKYWMPSDAIVSAHRPTRFAAPLLHLPYGTLSTNLPPKKRHRG